MTPAVNRRGRRIAWREAGSAPPTIVMLHGLGGSRTAWESQLADLGEDHRVVAWDMPGYGASSPVDGALTFDALADAVVELADELDAGRFHLVGLSLGGMIAQYAAAAHGGRIAGMILLSTSPRFGLDGTLPQRWRAERLAALDAGREPADFADVVLRSIAGPGIDDAAFAGQRDAMSRVTGQAMRRAIDCVVTHDSTGLLGSITTPTLVLAGALDRETPPAYGAALAERIPGARLEIIDGAGHLLAAEAPAAVNRLIREHVAAHP